MTERRSSDPHLRALRELDSDEQTPPATPSALASILRTELEQIETRLGKRLDDALESATRKLGDAVDAHLRAGMREIEGRIAVTVVNAMGERMIRLELAQKASEASHLVLEGKHKTLELRLGDQIADLDARLTRLMADYTELKFRLASIEQAIDGKHPATIPAPALDHD